MFQILKYLSLSIIFTGCTRPTSKTMSWISIERPPIRVIYIDEHHSISDDTINEIFKHIDGTKYSNYKFNKTIGISSNAKADRSIEEKYSNHTKLEIVK